MGLRHVWNIAYTIWPVVVCDGLALGGGLENVSLNLVISS